MKRGFTLVELMVVIFIIGILATVVMVNLSSSRAQSRDARRKADLKTVESALELYYNQKTTYPGGVDGYISCTASSSDLSRLLREEGYISAQVKDPKDGDCQGYIYYSSSEEAAYSLYSKLERPTSDDLTTYDSIGDQTAKNMGMNYRLYHGY